MQGHLVKEIEKNKCKAKSHLLTTTACIFGGILSFLGGGLFILSVSINSSAIFILIQLCSLGSSIFGIIAFFRLDKKLSIIASSVASGIFALQTYAFFAVLALYTQYKKQNGGKYVPSGVDDSIEYVFYIVLIVYLAYLAGIIVFWLATRNIYNQHKKFEVSSLEAQLNQNTVTGMSISNNTNSMELTARNPNEAIQINI